jgi:NAD(P)-dependent dehydrogenase (short-subunit alcohol dehydrogenase family)
VVSSASDQLTFDGQVAVVVGAGPGLGATLVRRFAAAGAGVVAVARSDASLSAAAEAARTVDGHVFTVAADVTSPLQTRDMADQIRDRFGRVDVLVNLAFGVAPRREILQMDDDDLETWRRVVESGGFGTLLACRYLLPFMVGRGSGSVVNVTSMSSRSAHAGRSEYAAGKAQAHKIAQSLADELGPQGIRVNCVAPGHIWSEQLAGYYRSRAEELGETYEAVLASYTNEMALRRIVTADEVANAVLFLASDLASGITGAVIDVNAGQLFAP